MSAQVCVLDPVRAELYEGQGTIPDCKFHQHVRRRDADLMVGNDDGQGRARRLLPARLSDTGALDRQERITLLPRILRWTSKPAWRDAIGARGPSVMVPVYENLR